MSKLRKAYEKFMAHFQKFQEYIKRKDKNLYERWKAGGFIVDENIMSMYPSLREAVDSLTD